MKKLLTILCLIGIVGILTACDNGDSGGKGSTIPEVSYDLFDTSDWVTCYNTKNSVVTNPTQTCTWDCATYQGSRPQFWRLTFFWDEAADEYSLIDIDRGACRL